MSAYAQTYQFPKCDVCGLRKPCVEPRSYWAGDVEIDADDQCEECAMKSLLGIVPPCDECRAAIADGEMEAV